MAELELASMEELLNELERRTPAGTIVIDVPAKTQTEGFFRTKNWGSSVWVLGALRLAEKQVLEKFEEIDD